jgi:hypothetical protein
VTSPSGKYSERKKKEKSYWEAVSPPIWRQPSNRNKNNMTG